MGSNLWDHGQGTQFGPMTPSETTAEWTRPQKKSLWKMIWASESWVKPQFKTRCIVHVNKNSIFQWIGLVGKIETGNRRFSYERWVVPVLFPSNKSIDFFKTSVYGDMPQPVWGHWKGIPVMAGKRWEMPKHGKIIGSSEDFPATEGRCSIYSPTATLVLLTDLANDLGHQMIIPYIFPIYFPFTLMILSQRFPQNITMNRLHPNISRLSCIIPDILMVIHGII